MTKPTKYPEWALLDILEKVIVTDENGNVVLDVDGNPLTKDVPNKSEYSDDYKNKGFLTTSAEVKREDLNYLLNLQGEWIKYFDSVIESINNRLNGQ